MPEIAYRTIDGKYFNDFNIALEHENQYIKNKLEHEKIIKEVKKFWEEYKDSHEKAIKFLTDKNIPLTKHNLKNVDYKISNFERWITTNNNISLEEAKIKIALYIVSSKKFSLNYEQFVVDKNKNTHIRIFRKYQENGAIFVKRDSNVIRFHNITNDPLTIKNYIDFICKNINFDSIYTNSNYQYEETEEGKIIVKRKNNIIFTYNKNYNIIKVSKRLHKIDVQELLSFIENL